MISLVVRIDEKENHEYLLCWFNLVGERRDGISSVNVMLYIRYMTNNRSDYQHAHDFASRCLRLLTD